MATSTSGRARHDRWADWAVIAVLVVALLLGWAVMTLAQGQREVYTDAETGLTLHYPQNWLLTGDESLLFQALDPDSGAFRTRYQVRQVPIQVTGELTPTLGAALSDASLWRAQQGTAYRLLDMNEGKAVGDSPTMEATYVFVAESSDFFTQRLPVVVLGLDIARAHGDQAFIFSLLADEAAFPEAEPAFRRFVNAAEFP